MTATATTRSARLRTPSAAVGRLGPSGGQRQAACAARRRARAGARGGGPRGPRPGAGAGPPARRGRPRRQPGGGRAAPITPSPDRKGAGGDATQGKRGTKVAQKTKEGGRGEGGEAAPPI